MHLQHIERLDDKIIHGASLSRVDLDTRLRARLARTIVPPPLHAASPRESKTVPQIDFDGEIAEDYERGRSLSDEALRVWRDAVAPHVPSSGAIVDVGAGTGRFARPLSALAHRTVIAVEPAGAMRRAQPDSDADIAWVAGTAEALPLSGASNALVWSAFTTHHIDLERAATEIVRVLRPGGRALIWNVFPDVLDGVQWLRWFPTARAIDEERMPTAGTVRTTFESAGLRFAGRSDHQMWLAPDLATFADLLAYRSLSSLRLISDRDFEQGLRRLRAAAAEHAHGTPVLAPNVMLRFDRPA